MRKSDTAELGQAILDLALEIQRKPPAARAKWVQAALTTLDKQARPEHLDLGKSYVLFCLSLADCLDRANVTVQVNRQLDELLR